MWEKCHHNTEKKHILQDLVWWLGAMWMNFQISTKMLENTARNHKDIPLRKKFIVLPFQRPHIWSFNFAVKVIYVICYICFQGKKKYTLSLYFDEDYCWTKLRAKYQIFIDLKIGQINPTSIWLLMVALPRMEGGGVVYIVHLSPWKR